MSQMQYCGKSVNTIITPTRTQVKCSWRQDLAGFRVVCSLGPGFLYNRFFEQRTLYRNLPGLVALSDALSPRDFVRENVPIWVLDAGP
jgi:hypothetical protein